MSIERRAYGVRGGSAAAGGEKRQLKRMADATTRALQARGVRNFDTLTHAQQLRFAELMGWELTELNHALETHTRGKRGELASVATNGTVTYAPAKGERADGGLDAEMASDPQVWATALVIEHKLGLSPRGSAAKRYRRVTERLEKLRQRSIKGKLSDREDDLIDRYRRQLREAENRRFERERERLDAASSLDRQIAAMRRASEIS